MPVGVPSTTFTQPVPSAKIELVRKVLQLYGLSDDGEFQALALGWLDDTVKEMNAGLWEFNKVTYSGGVLVAGTATYTMPSAFYRESQAYLVNTSGEHRTPLTYLPYVHFERQYGDPLAAAVSGEPAVYSIFNVHRNGQVKLAPTPDTSVASSYTLTVEYYRRIPLVSVTDPLDVPQEIEIPLLFGAQKRLAIHLNGAAHEDVMALDALQQRALSSVKVVDRSHPDEKMRFRIVDNINRHRVSGRGAIYVRI